MRVDGLYRHILANRDWYSLDNAIVLATVMHEGQVRKGSHEPYILHPMRVLGRFPPEERFASHRIVAILHDVIEDTELTLDYLADRWIGPADVLPALDAITRRKPAGETHRAYVERCAQDDIAVSVKLADVLDNLRDAFCESLGMAKRYQGDLAKLTGIAYHRDLWIPS